MTQKIRQPSTKIAAFSFSSLPKASRARLSVLELNRLEAEHVAYIDACHARMHAMLDGFQSQLDAFRAELERGISKVSR